MLALSSLERGSLPTVCQTFSLILVDAWIIGIAIVVCAFSMTFSRNEA